MQCLREFEQIFIKFFVMFALCSLLFLLFFLVVFFGVHQQKYHSILYESGKKDNPKIRNDSGLTFGVVSFKKKIRFFPPTMYVSRVRLRLGGVSLGGQNNVAP